MDSAQFKTVAQSLLKDSTFADFTIRCGEKEYKVHRFILSCHSTYFKKCFEGKYKEAESNVIELKEDDAEAVDLMLTYFYAFDYEDTPKASAKLSNATELNAAVYAVADKYDVVDLKTLAKKKFGAAIGSFVTNKRDPLPAMRVAYGGTPPGDRGLRDICVGFWLFNACDLLTSERKDEVAAFLTDTPQFGADIAIKVGQGAKDAKTSTGCDCHESHYRATAQPLNQAMQHTFPYGNPVTFSVPMAVDQSWLDE